MHKQGTIGFSFLGALDASCSFRILRPMDRLHRATASKGYSNPPDHRALETDNTLQGTPPLLLKHDAMAGAF